jgi:hypothetical protein
MQVLVAAQALVGLLVLVLMRELAVALAWLTLLVVA